MSQEGGEDRMSVGGGCSGLLTQGWEIGATKCS